MMTIVIVGAGDVGSYVASILSKQGHNIILIDRDKPSLETANWQMDIATRHGSGTDWKLLDDMLELSPQLFISLTRDDETNLVACSIAKHLGYPKTIARVKGERFLNRTRLDFSRIFDVDYFIGPELLVAEDIVKVMMSSGSLALESFLHGAIKLRTLLVPDNWQYGTTRIKDLRLPDGVMIGLIHRKQSLNEYDKDHIHSTKYDVIFPHGDSFILPKDEVTFIGEKEAILDIHEFFGLTQKKIESVLIVGGSLTAWNLATLLNSRGIDVRIIEKNYDKCVQLAEQLPNSIIMHHDAADLPFLLAEKVENTDMVVTSTQSDEVNILTAMLAKQAGCPLAVVRLSNISYLPIVEKFGLKHVVSPRISTANHILSHILSRKTRSLVSLYENQAEVLEIKVSLESKIVGIPLSDLGPLLPKDFLIAIIQNRGRIMIARGNRIISPGDTVIVITNPKHVEDLEKIF